MLYNGTPQFQILSEILTQHKLKFQNQNLVENVLIILVEDFVFLTVRC